MSNRIISQTSVSNINVTGKAGRLRNVLYSSRGDSLTLATLNQDVGIGINIDGLGEVIYFPNDFNSKEVNVALNGRFDTDSVWGKGANWSISGGTASTTSPTDLTQDCLKVGATYRITFEVVSSVGGKTIQPLAGTAAGTAVSGVGFHTETLTTTADNTLIFRGGGTGTSIEIDNVSAVLDSGVGTPNTPNEDSIMLPGQSLHLPTSNQLTFNLEFSTSLAVNVTDANKFFIIWDEDIF